MSETRSYKALDTRYHGIYFRSRLEARYAVFFDGIDLEWEYEPEGFRLPSGEVYLPDFYLRQVKMWVEVKPDFQTYASENKMAAFVVATGFSSLLLDGSPTCRSYFGFHKFQDIADPVAYSLDIKMFGRAFREGRLWSQPTFDPNTPLLSNYSEQYQAAVNSALSARFQ